MRRHPGVGEVTGAIMLTASFAAAAAILFVAFQERLDAAGEASELQSNAGMRRAAELVHTGPVQCGTGFLVHNYSPHPLSLRDITIYGTSGGRAYAAETSYEDLGGAPLDILEGGRSAWVRTGAACPMVLVTPAGDHLRVGD